MRLFVRQTSDPAGTRDLRLESVTGSRTPGSEAKIMKDRG